MGKLNRRNFCQCPCHGIVKSGNRYINGHNRRGTNHITLEETKQKMRLSHGPFTEEQKQNMRIAQNKSEVKAKRAQTNARPEVKKKRRQSQIIAQNKPETKAKRSQTKARPEVKERRSQSQIKCWQDPEFREKTVQAQIIAHNTPESKEKQSQSTTKLWQDPEFREMMVQSVIIAAKKRWQSPDYVKKQMKARNVKQNKTEKKLEDTISKVLPNEYKFVGHGEVVIAGKCPDFINVNGQKKIIELFGDYWHRDDIPGAREKIFAEYGYDTLIIWEHEFEDIDRLKMKLNEFHIRENPYSKHGVK